ncbi:MAG: ATP-dependent zinc metalloprotease FtsH [Arcanobacterium sp.]|nr:ATP-dependent zinc metalloprotease FtsH [Arcanobacterium sp.]
MFVWFVNPFGFTAIQTSEGLQILEKQELERVQVTAHSEVVQVWLEKDYTPTDIQGNKMPATRKVQFQYVPAEAEQVNQLVHDAKATHGFNSVVPTESFLSTMFSLLLPMLILVGIFVWLFPRLQGTMTGFGKLKREGFDSDRPDVTFEDVAGEDEAVQELREIREFLETPDKFRKMGARIPKGVLLYGPPGTGKTLLARAVAGEAGVPFFNISASEFVEMFVGVGASRVRDLFNRAKKVAPAIVFVDEIDAVGRNRGSGIGGGNDEREQTLNQLLVEMDGFDDKTNVIVIAATNRPDVLDSALLRPGRFDRQIAVDAPDLPGRKAILAVHAKGKPLEDDVQLESIARRTPGFSGADLSNVLNEAALLAARRDHHKISMDDVDEAIDRVIAGPQRATRVMNEADKLMTAYHEGGHAVAAAALNYTDPVTKVTILPRGRALGYTMVMPAEDRYSVSRNQLLDELVYSMGGRAAEEIVFHDPSTGASNDIQKATNTARKMVTEYGMSSRIGSMRLAADEADPMSRFGGGQQREFSDALAHTVDEEVRQLLETAMQEAWQLLMDNRSVLDTLASRLLEKETVLEEELKEIFADVKKAPLREQWLSAPSRPVSDIPPIAMPPARKQQVDQQAQPRSAADEAVDEGEREQ